MRHLHFTQSLEPLQGGGLGSSALGLHRQMCVEKIPSVLCATHGGKPQQNSKAIREYRRVGPNALYFSPGLLREAPGLVRESEIVHGHGLYVGTNYIFGRECRRQHKPLVYHVHGIFEPYILARSQWKKRLVHVVFENANFKTVRLWRALTLKEADQIRGRGLKQPVVVAPNGLNLADFEIPSSQPAPIPGLDKDCAKSEFRLLFLGRIHPKKGLDLLIKAFSELGSASRDWHVVIAGPDELGHESVIRRQAEALGIMNQLVFTGPVSGDVKTSLLHSADLFVLPSYSEGFSMSVLEAMACGLPVVATHACNFPEITEVQSGWECEATEESLKSALETAMESGAVERHERGQKGRRLVETRYTWTAVIQTLQHACAAYC